MEAINTSAAYGQGRGRIWLNGLGCTGYEQSVFNCTHRPLGDTYGCGHNEDVGLICSNSKQKNYIIYIILMLICTYPMHIATHIYLYDIPITY